MTSIETAHKNAPLIKRNQVFEKRRGSYRSFCFFKNALSSLCLRFARILIAFLFDIN